MKRYFLPFLLALTPAFAVSPVGLLPEDKTPVVVRDVERNPFAAKLTTAEVVAEVKENEEGRIRIVISSLPVAGVTQSAKGTKVLLGPHVMEAGQMVPPLVSNQSEKLKVLSVTGKKLELGFLEKDGNVADRKVSVVLDLTPKVQFKLGKQPEASYGGGFDGVITTDEVDTP